jgi:hypothetical protein
MPVHPSILADNAAQLRRLQSIVTHLGNNDRDLDGGWTVAVALAHLAFWDRRAVLLLDYWRKHGRESVERHDDDIINAALLDEWKALTLRQAAELALSAAKAVNAAVEAMDDRTAEAVVMAGKDRLLHRGPHRREHLDQIERVLSGG